jgi:hypothetical protein
LLVSFSPEIKALFQLLYQCLATFTDEKNPLCCFLLKDDTALSPALLVAPVHNLAIMLP